MRYFVAALALSVLGSPSFAQQVIYNDPVAGPICSGPLGPGPCAAVMQYLRQQGTMVGAPPVTAPMGNAGMQPPFPGAGMFPQDGIIVASIAQQCGGQPMCMASAWGSVEVQRCRNGIGTSGGCFGPNGEIMRVVNRMLPQNLHPDVILHNIDNDIHNGPSSTNDVVGCNGWLAHRVGAHC